jgi:undecaprenyl-diphosphatase
VLVALAIGVGLLLVHAILPFHGIGSADEHVNEVLARHRSSDLNDATYVGSMIGDVPTIPALVTLAVVVAAVLRRWRVAGFVLGAILVEVATYRLTSLIVHRERPTVPRLDDLPVNQSYPSGHVAASVAVYGGLALLLAAWARRGSVAAACWTLAVALVAVVAFSRMDRGMHHPSDAAAGVLIGTASLAVALLAVRAGGATAERRRRRA